MIIDPAVAADLDAIHEIERHSFKVAWPGEMFEAELARGHARVDVMRDPHVIGFCNYWLVTASAEVHILSIATHPDRRRSGIAARLLAHALDAGRAIGATLATLEVRRGNRPAIALYERAGFKTVHVRTGYYQEDGEDALVMLAELTPARP
jgi:ribosomal-protein-alanine N-acetyltransferase